MARVATALLAHGTVLTAGNLLGQMGLCGRVPSFLWGDGSGSDVPLNEKQFISAPVSAPPPTTMVPDRQSAGWRWSQSVCANPADLVFKPPPATTDLTQLDSFVENVVVTFRDCGVVAITDVLPKDLLTDLLDGVTADLRPYVQSRSRLREAMLNVGSRQHRSYGQYKAALRDLWDSGVLRDELILAGGYTLRERSSGRLDYQIGNDRGTPFNSSRLTASAVMLRVLQRLLGERARLKSMHVVSGLSGCPEQDWHRDAPLLWPECPLFSPEGSKQQNVHARDGGVHLPPYALNVFYNLRDLTRTSGATEFAPSSHQWGEIYSDEPCYRAQTCPTRVFNDLPAGSAVIGDYRTLHRGTANMGLFPRHLMMLVYGREWWYDTVNYGVNFAGLNNGFELPEWTAANDEGRRATLLHHFQSASPCDDGKCKGSGAHPSVPRGVSASSLSGREAAFWGFADLWEDELAEELQRRHAAL